MAGPRPASGALTKERNLSALKRRRSHFSQREGQWLDLEGMSSQEPSQTGEQKNSAGNSRKDRQRKGVSLLAPSPSHQLTGDARSHLCTTGLYLDLAYRDCFHCSD